MDTLDELEDLDFADDLAPLSNTQQQLEEKTNVVAENSAQLGLNIHKWKSTVCKVNATSSPIALDGEALGEVKNFTYLGSIVYKLSGTDASIKVCIRQVQVRIQSAKECLKGIRCHYQHPDQDLQHYRKACSVI